MDNEANQTQQDAAANQAMDAGTAEVQQPMGGDANVGQGLSKGEVPLEVREEAARQAPSVEEKLKAQNEENLQRAIEQGYKPDPEPSREERARMLVADMEHVVANNGPITVAMMREVRELLGVDRG